MKKTLFYSALIAALTASGINYARADERLLQKHHQRMKQRLSNPQNQQRSQPPMPYYQEMPEQAIHPQVPYYDNTTPSQLNPSVPPTQAPAPILTPAEMGIAPGQPSIQTPNINNLTGIAPEGRFTSNNAIDTRGLLANDRTGSPLSGPLNTIGDFFAPSASTFVIGPQIFQGSYRMTNSIGDLSTFSRDIDGRLNFNNLSYVSIDGRPPEYTGIGGGAARDFPSVQNGYPTGTNPAEAVLFNNPVNQAAVNQLIEGIYGSGTASTQGDLTATLRRVDINGDGLYSLDQGYVIAIPTDSTGPALVFLSAPGSQLGRTKLTEQNSPLPRDRFFFDYSFFHNAALSQSSTDVHRFAPGFEKTFLDNLCSIEMRMPMGITLNSAQTYGSFDSNHTELGNMAFALKGMLWSTNNFILTTGLGVQTPTADDNVVRRVDGSEAIRVANKQVRLLPYIATLHTTTNWFWQNYVQVDAAANGNDVFFNGQKSGVLQEQNFIYLDSSLSRWMYRDYRSGKGWALTGEVHYNRTLGTADSFASNGFVAGTPGFEADIVNLTFGSTYVLGKTTFTTAYGTPITKDRGFDGEFRLLVNRFF